MTENAGENDNELGWLPPPPFISMVNDKLETVKEEARRAQMQRRKRAARPLASRVLRLS